ncbi:hypothetical protein HKBW3S33_00123 [Candidatus Hakubella thermalkaliphila]|uniref:Polysaccharide pyruvyl transferase domain-containing protein n=1 Tax=Candidatus Hakubella thermalkaliphila TaxID=2754717 RepID=A0A6V8P2K6_9ACTN|nr:hypothetical protein HKBW3S33_00123 [Candidatus Hakubella thermalkaliphila]
MKGVLKRITLLGSVSGRNAGDVALIASIMSEIRNLHPEGTFEIPTINPAFIKKHYSHLVARPVSMLPWHLSVKMLGLPTFLSVRRADMVLVFDAVLFDRKLFNPLFNHMSALALLIPYAKKHGKLVAYYNVGVGPVYTSLGKKILASISNQADLITVRDEDSLNLLREVGVTRLSIHVTADAALNNQPAPPERVQEIMKEQGIFSDRRWIGMNVNTYVDTWVRSGEKGISRRNFQNTMAQVADSVMDDLDVDIVFFATQVMDIPLFQAIIQEVKKKERVRLVTNRDYTNHEIMGLLGQMELFVGMRLHSLILASAMYTPIVGLVYLPKVRSYLKEIGQPDQGLEFADFNARRLVSLIESTWERRELIRQQVERVGRLKEESRKAARLVVELLRQRDSG